MKIKKELKVILSLCLFLIEMMALDLSAQVTNGAEALDATAYLEKLVARRFADELSTQIPKDQFQLGATLQITKIKPVDKTPAAAIFDLDLSFIEPEKLYKKFQANDQEINAYLSKFNITQVDINIGLKKELGEKIKKDVNTWLQKRLKKEFGKLAKGKTQFIQFPKETPEAPRSPWLERLDQFQSLVGLGLLGLAILMGALLLALLGKKAIQDKNQSTVNVNSKLEGELQDKAKASKPLDEDELQVRTQLREVLNQINQQIHDITPKLTQEMEGILREWCSKGEPGFIKVACFSEVIGTSLGKLPIPSEFYGDVATAFVEMPKLAIQEKINNLESVLWDLLSVLNLGGEAIHQPFSYIGSAAPETVKEVLLENNSKLRTIVSLYMTDKSRTKYLNELASEDKLAMLNEAAQLAKISGEELQSLDHQLAPHFDVEETTTNVSMELTLIKLIDALSPLEACVLLKDVEGPEMIKYKRLHGQLSFLHQWPDEPLSLLFKQATNDELIAFLQVRKDLVTRTLELVPPMTRIIIEDDLGKARISDTDRNDLLRSFTRTLTDMVTAQNIDLETIFAKTKLKAIKDEQAA